ncbi:MAG: hypothetical protein U9R46_12325 [Bacteroidota bacterium]|nr:hypothetical protein [Bacteroidota bacterium]
MKIATNHPLTDNIQALSSAANQLFDHELLQEIRNLSEQLCPEWLAGYMGLKKLVEKNYRPDDDPHSFLLENG